MIILDTNVVSELMRPEPSSAVVDWVDKLPAIDVFLTAITVAELLYGVRRLPDGRRRSRLAELVDEMLDEEFDGRIAAFDATAARHYAQLVSDRDQAGRPISMADGQIAAIARSYGAQIATRNVSDFDTTGVEIVNPWTNTSR